MKALKCTTMALGAVGIRLKKATGFYPTGTLECCQLGKGTSGMGAIGEPKFSLLDNKALTGKSVQFHMIPVSYEGYPCKSSSTTSND